jgi:hypothetical protein
VCVCVCVCVCLSGVFQASGLVAIATLALLPPRVSPAVQVSVLMLLLLLVVVIVVVVVVVVVCYFVA